MDSDNDMKNLLASLDRDEKQHIIDQYCSPDLNKIAATLDVNLGL